jgi:hypothetical protein
MSDAPDYTLRSSPWPSHVDDKGTQVHHRGIVCREEPGAGITGMEVEGHDKGLWFAAELFGTSLPNRQSHGGVRLVSQEP